MAEIKLTNEQQAVVDDRGGTILVSAAAGSGKTKVLLDRVMKKVQQEGHNVDDFLMITFTKAAASELREKLIAQLSKALAQDPSDRHLQNQMSRVYLAQISTVHGFCKTLLKDYAHTLDIPTDFRICDEQEKQTVMEKTMTVCLDEAYGEGLSDPEIRAALNSLGHGRDDALLEKLIFKIQENLLCYPNPKERANELKRSLQRPEGDAEETLWGKFLVSEFCYWAKGAAYQFRRLAAQAEEQGVEPYVPVLHSDAHLLLRLSALRSWEELRTADATFEKASGKRCSASKEVREAIRKKRDILKKLLSDKMAVFSVSSEQILQDMENNGVALSGLLRLTERFTQLFSEEKRRRHMMDYNDLEHETLRLLYGGGNTPTRAAREISQRYAEIMVDEYQDTNAVQDAIFNAISREGNNLFFVGDIKQSIYRFRMAEPSIFLDKYLSYPDYTKAKPGEPRKILLSDNFRSHPAILEAANSVFRLTMSQRMGGLDYSDAEALRPNQKPVNLGSPPVELHCIDSAELSAYGKNAIEAEFVAQRISQMLLNRELISDSDGSIRPVRPGDIVILLRTMKGKADHYMDALRRHNIQSVCAHNNIYETEEICILTALLQIIDNPRQDIPLLTVLLSPLFRFSTGTLAKLRAEDRKGEIYDLLCGSEEAAPFLDQLSRLRDISQEVKIRVLLDEINLLLNLRCIFGAMPNGHQRLRNIEKFYEVVDAYESGNRFGLSGFLTYLEQAKKIPPANDTVTNETTVRIMSVHSSKGLEFPVVFLADLCGSFKLKELQAAVITDRDLGVACNSYDKSLGISYPSMPKQALAQRIRTESISEEMRILYVAMTRARSRMVMSGCSAGMRKRILDLMEVVSVPLVPGVSESAKSMGDWVILTALTRTESGELFALGENPGVSVVSKYPWLVRTHMGDAFIPQETVLKDWEEREDLPGAPAYLVKPYAMEPATRTPAKLTATQMKKGTEESETPEIHLRSPGFEKGGKRALSGAERGTAIHLAMQYLNYDLCDTREGLRLELDRLVKNRFLDYEQFRAISVEKLYRFFQSDLFRRMRSAKKLIREFKFSLLEDASYYDPALAGEKILLQGVTDCCIIEEDGLVVLDFKSDRIDPGREALRAEFYRGQLDAYSRALSRIFSMPVKERILWFFATDKAYTL